jgi:glycosyltransferase involved in cell wall biosynthesis
MHVAITVDPEIPVPPRHYGGIERIVDLLVRGLRARGHRVTLFAHPDSQVECELVPWRGAVSSSRRDTLAHAWQVYDRLRARADRPELVHSFARLAYLLPLLPRRVPKVQSYQRHISPRSVRWGHRLARGTLTFTACSHSCADSGGRIGNWRVIYNGVPLERYQFVAQVPDDAPLVFLGRLERCKGPHHAVAVARRTGRRLILAGNAPQQGEEAAYCRSQVLAHCDGRQIEYVGPVDDAGKSQLLGRAAALLFPIDWEEPFGIVMAEALACGTPVLAFPRGAVPEVITDGHNGFLCRDAEALAAAVGRLGALSRATCRQTVERRFSADVIVSQYEALYRSLLTAAGMADVGKCAPPESLPDYGLAEVPGNGPLRA